jgi:hypothetical protein
MNKAVTVLLALAVGLAGGIPLGNRVMPQNADDEEGVGRRRMPQCRADRR